MLPRRCSLRCGSEEEGTAKKEAVCSVLIWNDGGDPNEEVMGRLELVFDIHVRCKLGSGVVSVTKKSMSICMCVHVCACVCVCELCVYVCVCMCELCVYVCGACVCVCMCECVWYVYVSCVLCMLYMLCVCACVHVCVYMCVCTCVCTCVCVHVCVYYSPACHIPHTTQLYTMWKNKLRHCRCICIYIDI